MKYIILTFYRGTVCNVLPIGNDYWEANAAATKKAKEHHLERMDGGSSDYWKLEESPYTVGIWDTERQGIWIEPEDLVME